MTVPPVSDEQLMSIVDDLASRHLPDENTRRSLAAEPEEVRAELRTLLSNAARHQYQAVESVKRLTALRDEWRQQGEARRAESQASARAPEVKAMSDREFEAAQSEVWAKWDEADKAGKWLDKQRYSDELTRLAKARWS
jgi:hypothetical protein